MTGWAQNDWPQTLADTGPDSRLVADLVPSPNIGGRRDGAKAKFLILHYTGLESVERSIAVLSDPACQVSCHYVIDTDGRITQMVREADRAWHAGLSFWQGETDINSWSIGIEIQNPGHTGGMPPYPDVQMRSVGALAREIVGRWAMRPEHVLAHSDIAPQRKIDPGEVFDWQRLFQGGVGHWIEPRPAGDAPEFDPATPSDAVRRCQALLIAYGYDVAEDGLSGLHTRNVISAFQRHFRPARVDGLPDQSTIATLEDLLAALKPQRNAGDQIVSSDRTV